jgi:hypothetical protein
MSAKRGRDHHRHPALHVEGAAAPEVSIDDVTAKRALLPFLVYGRDDVHVALEQQRRRLFSALDTSDEIRTAGRVFVSRTFDACFLEHPLNQGDSDVLLARRVGGVEADEIASQLDDERERLHFSDEAS